MIREKLELLDNKMKQNPSFLQPFLITNVIMLLLGMFSGWPYGYYTLLKLVVFIAGVLITIAAYKMQKHWWMIGSGMIALLFNPFMPVHFDKATWRVIDFIVAIVFLVLIFRIRSRRSSR